MSVIFRGLESVWSGIKAVDDTILGIGEAATNTLDSDKSNDNKGFFNSSFEVLKRSVDGTSYVATAIQKGCIYGPGIFATTIDPAFTHFLQGASMTNIMGGIGLLGSTLGFISNTIALNMQEETLKALSNLPTAHGKVEDKDALIQALKNLKNINYHQVLLTLPDYLKNKLEEKSKSGEPVFDTMLTDIDKDCPTHAHELLHEMKTGAIKKEVYHELGQITSALGIVTACALLLGCPMIGLIILTVIGVALAIAGILLKKGWVENHEKGFNWKLCLPEALQKKLNVDRDIETEMLNADTFTSRLHQNLRTSSAMPIEEMRFSDTDSSPKRPFWNWLPSFLKEKYQPDLIAAEVDPITQAPLEPEDKLIVINNIQFSAETLAFYLVTNKNNDYFLTTNKSKVKIWKNDTEHLAILKLLLPLIENSTVIKGIEMRIKSLEDRALGSVLKRFCRSG